MNKVDIEHRKAALDEWKARNPEGEVKVTEDGKLVVINKLTGKSLDTGLKADHLSEEQKIKLQISGQKEVEAERQKGRLKVEDRKDAREALKSGTPISPSQQRVAEDDAATELLRDPKYSWLAKGGHVTVDKDGVHINRPTSMDSDFFGASSEDKKKGVTAIDAFEKEWKSKAKERMNLSRDKEQLPDVSTNNDTVQMLAPDGRQLQVPKTEVERMKGLGATISGETPVLTPNKISNDIELFYNDRGEVIGARNKKG
jgi:hypothetical protein